MVNVVSKRFEQQLNAARGEGSNYRLPEALYHYTDLNAFKQIVASGSIWMSDIRFLNDATEVSYGSEYCLDRMLSALKGKTGRLAQRTAELLPRSGKHGELGWHFYVFSLCATGNLLNQWRLYGGSQMGVSIGFDAQKLKRMDTRLELLECLYEESDQAAAATEITDHFVKAFEEYEPLFADEDIVVAVADALRIYRADTLYSALRFKSLGFKEEREWRLVAGESGSPVNAEYRVGRYGLTPYIVAQPANSAKLPLRSVTLGPSRFAGGQEEVVRDFLRKHGYHDVSVGTTDTSYRPG